MKTKLHTIELPSWLVGLTLTGADGEPAPGAPGAATDSAAGAPASGTEGDDEDDTDTPPEGMSQEDFDKLPADHPVRKALHEERKLHRQATRENRRLQREADARKAADDAADLAKKSELEQAQTKQTKAEEKATKLSTGFLTLRLDSAIEKAARDAKFIDVDDAIQGVDRSKIEYTQDPDDPSKVTVEATSIKKVVADLSRRKPHLIGTGTTDGAPTGSPFGGGKPGGKKTTDEQLKEAYPALR